MRISSISTRAMLILIAVSVIIVVVLGGLWLYTTKQYIENDIYASDNSDSHHMADYVAMYLSDITSNQAVISTNPDTVNALKENDSDRLTAIADNLYMSSPKPDAVYIVDNQGRIMSGTMATNLSNVSFYPWYDAMARSKEPFITGLFYSYTLKDYGFAILTPVQSNNTIYGRIMVLITPKTLQESVKEHNLDPRDNIIILDNQGGVITSDDLSKVSRDTNLSRYTPAQRLLNGEGGVVAHTDSWDGQPRISAFQPIARSGWGVIVSTPQNVEYRPLNDLMMWIVGLLLAFIAIVAVLGYFSSRYLTDPIVSLSETMNRISGGSYDLRANMGRNDEIGELARTFNTMMDNLEEAKSQSEMYMDLMGHDINNMNQVALGYLQIADQMIDAGSPVGKENEALIKKPIQAIQESTKLIENVRKIQRAKTEEMRNKIVNMGELLEDLRNKYSHVPGREITIDFTSSGKFPVQANDLLKDVFSNLLWNAINHSDPGKPLFIYMILDELEQDGTAYYRVAVEDNGPGIPDEMKALLFSRFSRGQTKAKGSGLGLYLVRTLVADYGGKTWIEDRVPGDRTQGSRFVVLLPAYKE